MRAIIQERYGGPELLGLREIDRPVPGSQETLVRVRAVSVNAGDWHLLCGDPYLARLSIGLCRPPSAIPGTDFAGITAGDAAHPPGQLFGRFGGQQVSILPAGRTRPTSRTCDSPLKPARCGRSSTEPIRWTAARRDRYVEEGHARSKVVITC